MASVLRPGLLRQDGVCLARVHDLPQHVQRATVHAEGDRECRGLLCVALQPSLFDAVAAQPDVMYRQEAAGRLVGVHDVPQPTQLDEQPVRVAVLRAVELFHALGGLPVAQVRATQESLDPTMAGTAVESLCIEPFAHQASDRQRAEAQGRRTLA